METPILRRGIQSLRRPARPARRTFRPRLETLEGRDLPAGFQPTAVEQQMLEQLNDARANPAAYGATIGVDLSGVAPSQPLAFDPLLVQAARQHAQDMNTRGYFGQNTPEGTDPGQRMSQVGFNWITWGESSIGGAAYSDPASALRALVIDASNGSLSDRRQLLSIDTLFKTQGEIGIGIVQNGNGPLRNYYTVDTASILDDAPV